MKKIIICRNCKQDEEICFFCEQRKVYIFAGCEGEDAYKKRKDDFLFDAPFLKAQEEYNGGVWPL